MNERQERAERALAALGSHRSAHQRLNVQCPRSHHVAGVYETEVGLVYHAIEGPHAHGSKDRVDTAHHGGTRGADFVDLLAAGPMSDDGLPAWCDCGPWTLSRERLIEDAALRPGTVRVG
ncbi:MAG: hypothetical protein H6528_11315 [Actinobacteria bacterium]|nr:hypothetical protein [Actinomycetota bacterium]MCB9423975.1 hypothetical protein [Actinomycetota bacterium]